MKKWSALLALILCLIATGGLISIFNSYTPDEPKNEQNSSIEKPVGGSDSQGDETPIEHLILNQSNLIF